jgi:hypothetical protein
MERHHERLLTAVEYTRIDKRGAFGSKILKGPEGRKER